jgi:hypothetical protein
MIFYSEFILPYVFCFKPVHDHFIRNAEAKSTVEDIKVYFLSALLVFHFVQMMLRNTVSYNYVVKKHLI